VKIHDDSEGVTLSLMILDGAEIGDFPESDAIHRFLILMTLLSSGGFPEKASLGVFLRPKHNVTPFDIGSVVSHDNVTLRGFPFFAKAP